MANEDHRAILCGQRPLGDGDIVRQRPGGMLDDRNRVALLLERPVDALPARPVYKSAMNEHDVLDSIRRAWLWHGTSDGPVRNLRETRTSSSKTQLGCPT